MSTDNTTTAAVARREEGPGALVAKYKPDFAAVLPSHIKPDTWARLAQGALKKGRKGDGGRYELEIAAANNPGVFLSSLLDAARLGLEPGTEQYYLTPRKVKGRLEILGIVGYQGYIELMYRAGAISSVVAECVYSGDTFRFRPGVDERPQHEIDWDADDRGNLRLVYAYAVMKDGATSKVVVLNRAAINKIKQTSQGADSQYSPWKTHEGAMWLKSAVRQLAKWVPTSSEYMREQLRVQREVDAETDGGMTVPQIPQQPGDDGAERGHMTTADGQVIEAELVDDEAEYLGAVDAEHDAARDEAASV